MEPVHWRTAIEFNTVRIKPLNETHIIAYSEDRGIEKEMWEFFTYKAPGFQHNPKFKSKFWDGNIRLYKIREKTLYKGLIPFVETFCEERGYRLINQIEDLDESFSLNECKEFLDSLKLPAKLEPRDYQIKAIAQCVRKGRAVMVSPTASGKSFIIYSLIRHYFKKTLLIVPTTALVHQMFGDFQEYSQNDPTWDVALECSKVMGGMSKETRRVIIHLEDGSTISLPRGERVKIINNGKSYHKLVEEIGTKDEIDDNWLAAYRRKQV